MVRLTLSAPLCFLLLLLCTCPTGSYPKQPTPAASVVEMDAEFSRVLLEYQNFRANDDSTSTYQLLMYAIARHEQCAGRFLLSGFVYKYMGYTSINFRDKLLLSWEFLKRLSMPLPRDIGWIFSGRVFKDDIQDIIRDLFAIPKYQDKAVMDQYLKMSTQGDKSFCKELVKLDKLLYLYEEVKPGSDNKSTFYDSSICIPMGYRLIFEPFKKLYWIEQVRQYVDFVDPSGMSRFRQFLDRIDVQVFLGRLISILGPRKDFNAFKFFVHNMDKEHFKSIQINELKENFSKPEAPVLLEELIELPREIKKYFVYQKPDVLVLRGGYSNASVVKLIGLIREDFTEYENIYSKNDKLVATYDQMLFIKLGLMLIEEAVFSSPKVSNVTKKDPEKVEPKKNQVSNYTLNVKPKDPYKKSSNWIRKVGFGWIFVPPMGYGLFKGISWIAQRLMHSDAAPELRISIDNSTVAFTTVSSGGSIHVFWWVVLLGLLFVIVVAVVFVVLFKGSSNQNLTQGKVSDNPIKTAASVSTPRTTSSATPSATPRTNPNTISSATPRTNPSTTLRATPRTNPSTTSRTTSSTKPSTTESTTPRTNPRTISSTTPSTKPSTTQSATPRTNPRTISSATPRTKPSTTQSTTPRTNPSTTSITTSSTKPSTTPNASSTTTKPTDSNLKTSTKNDPKKNHKKSPKHSSKLSSPKKSSPKGGSKM